MGWIGTISWRTINPVWASQTKWSLLSVRIWYDFLRCPSCEFQMFWQILSGLDVIFGTPKSRNFALALNKLNDLEQHHQFPTCCTSCDSRTDVVVSWVIGIPPVIIHFERWDFSWNKPSSDKGVPPMAMETPSGARCAGGTCLADHRFPRADVPHGGVWRLDGNREEIIIRILESCHGDVPRSGQLLNYEGEIRNIWSKCL